MSVISRRQAEMVRSLPDIQKHLGAICWREKRGEQREVVVTQLDWGREDIGDLQDATVGYVHIDELKRNAERNRTSYVHHERLESFKMHHEPYPYTDEREQARLEHEAEYGVK